MTNKNSTFWGLKYFNNPSKNKEKNESKRKEMARGSNLVYSIDPEKKVSESHDMRFENQTVIF